MSLKRKRTSLTKDKVAAASAPEPPKSPSPPPWNHPFPRLPTVEDSASPLPDAELKSIADSGVLTTALLQSRELWVQGYHFPKVWKPTRRGRKDPPPTSQYITTRLGICPVVIGPHIFPDTRFLSVRKVDENAEKPEKPEKPPKPVKVAPPPPPPPPTPVPPPATSNSLTVKALTEIAATSPEFSAILQAVANKTATPEQNAALAQYMRAASLFGPARTAAATASTPSTPSPAPTGATVTKPITPVTTIPKPPIKTVPTPSPIPTTSPSKLPISNVSASTQSAPIPPVPKSTPHLPVPLPVQPRFISTPVTRIPPPSGNLNPIALPSVNRAPISTPVTRIPPPSTTPIIPPKPATPATLTPLTSTLQTPTPITSTRPISTPAASTPASTPAPSTPVPIVPQPSATPAPATPQTPQPDPMQFVEIGFELTEPGERLLLPRHTILEKFTSPQGGINVLASFILTINNNSIYIPITLKLSDCPSRIWETLHKYVHPQPVVAKEMERIMNECKRFQRSVLQLRIPVEEESYTWNGIKKEPERKKYQRKKKEDIPPKKGEDDKEEEGGESGGKKRKSLVVGLKYTPTKKELVS